MKNRKTITRKLFIQILAGIGTGLFTWIWYKLSEFQDAKESQSEFRHNADIPLGTSYCGKYYLYRKGNSVHAFSTKCTHAGCLIGKSNTGILQCNCHGSQFDAETGKPLKGPAIKPLRELNCLFDPSSGQWIVKLQPNGNALVNHKI